MERCGLCDCEVEDWEAHKRSLSHRRRLADEALMALAHVHAGLVGVLDPTDRLIEYFRHQIRTRGRELDRAESQVTAVGS